MYKQGIVMQLKGNNVSEYKRRHQEVFPKLEELFTKAGVEDYTIWLNQKSGELFAYVNYADKQVWNSIENTLVCREWWDYMADIMEVNADNSPVSFELDLMYDFKGAK